MKYIKTFESYVFGREEFVEIKNPSTGESIVIKAKIDTESYHTNIDIGLLTELNLLRSEETIYTLNIFGESNLPTTNVCLTFNTGDMKGRVLDTTVTLADRSLLKHRVAIGRFDIEKLGVLIDVNKSL